MVELIILLVGFAVLILVLKAAERHVDRKRSLDQEIRDRATTKRYEAERDRIREEIRRDQERRERENGTCINCRRPETRGHLRFQICRQCAELIKNGKITEEEIDKKHEREMLSRIRRRTY